jgi:hypothetical protein
MEHGRRLAADAPALSAAALEGPHLLGRIYEPDARDWSLGKLMEIAEPPESIAQQTVEQILEGTEYFSTWPGYLVFWRWLKRQRAPSPPAGHDDHPAWGLDIQLDQGQTNHCVGFAWAGWGDSAPVRDTYQNADAHAIYYEVKVIDGQPKGENGSTVRSGAKAMRARNRLSAYGFAKSTEEIDTWVDESGPLVVGTTWTSDMFSPDANGFVAPTGAPTGGHCYLLIDRLADEDAYLFQNSWGEAWGLNGRFKMKRSEFGSMLSVFGEACCAAELPR